MRTRRQPPQSTPPRSKTMEQDGLAPLPLHGSSRHRACWTWSASSGNRTPSLKARRPLMDGALFIGEATGTALSADLVLWNVGAIAEQPRLRSRVEGGAD